MSTAKKIQKARATLNDNAPAGANYCAEYFPAIDKYLAGDTITVRDTITTTEVLEVNVETPGKTIKVPCPATKTITIKQTIHDTIVRVDRARETVLTTQLGESIDRGLALSRENDTLKEYKNSMRGKVHIPIWWLIVAAILGGGFVYLKTKTSLLKGLIK
jgi:hypothetical protein